jgi:hypothetical protein
MLRSKAYPLAGHPPNPDEDDDGGTDLLGGFDPHSFCHDPVYRHLVGELLAELSEVDEDSPDDRPLRPN